MIKFAKAKSDGFVIICNSLFMKKYQAPEVEVVEISLEGSILTPSGNIDPVNSNEGTWSNGFYYEYESGLTYE